MVGSLVGVDLFHGLNDNAEGSDTILPDRAIDLFSLDPMVTERAGSLPVNS
ncbi:MAG: hypothetical protein VYA30_07635 [Myxococcota bacterium]|nr:hypothetical protein [Myxococcota bacterium]